MRLIILAAGLMLVCPAGAEVTAAGEGGFELMHEISIAARRVDVWHSAVGEVGLWWHDDHTISGDAGRLRIEAIPNGCFCETLGEEGSVVHLTVTFVNKNVLLRMTGGLGPLGLIGVNGNMLWEFADDHDSTRVTFSYAVGGYYPDGLDTIADAVDSVIGEALRRLKAHIESGDADNAKLD